MNIKPNQMGQGLRDIIKTEIDLYDHNDISITDRNEIPSSDQIPLDKPNYWIKINDVVCVYIDMIGSTKLSATKRPKTMARVYRLFTQTTTQILHSFEAPYIDIKGDGVFALFNQNQVYRAFASAISVKTFMQEEFCPRIEKLDSDEKNIGAHIGIDQGPLIVKTLGLRMRSRKDRQNEVWAGKTVNMASKLASKTTKGELLVSERYFSKITDDLVRKSCECNNKANLWAKIQLNDVKFDFENAFLLKTIWCSTHGDSYCRRITSLDK